MVTMPNAISVRDVQAENPANTAPKFADDQDPNMSGDQADAERSVAENAKGAVVGDPVTAVDDDNDLMLYSISDMESFSIDRASGQIKTKVELDYETKAMYMVVVTATDSSGASDTINVMISVTDEDDKTTIGLVTEPEPVTPEPEPEMADCSNVAAVDSTNAGLVADCEALLDSMDALAGDNGSLNWSADMAIADWDGVQGHPMFPSRSGDPMRVTALHLQNMELDGEIPAAIGRLDALMYLNVHSNESDRRSVGSGWSGEPGPHLRQQQRA